MSLEHKAFSIYYIPTRSPVTSSQLNEVLSQLGERLDKHRMRLLVVCSHMEHLIRPWVKMAAEKAGFKLLPLKVPSDHGGVQRTMQAMVTNNIDAVLLDGEWGHKETVLYGHLQVVHASTVEIYATMIKDRPHSLRPAA